MACDKLAWEVTGFKLELALVICDTAEGGT